MLKLFCYREVLNREVSPAKSKTGFRFEDKSEPSDMGQTALDTGFEGDLGINHRVRENFNNFFFWSSYFIIENSLFMSLKNH